MNLFPPRFYLAELANVDGLGQLADASGADISHCRQTMTNRSQTGRNQLICNRATNVRSSQPERQTHPFRLAITRIAQLAGIANCPLAPMSAAAFAGIIENISGKRCPAEYGGRLPVCRAERPGRPDRHDRPISQHEPGGGTSIGPEPVPASWRGGRCGLLLVVREMESGA